MTSSEDIGVQPAEEDDVQRHIRNRISNRSKAFGKKLKPQDLSWDHVNFKIGEKDILVDCWGSVRTF